MDEILTFAAYRDRDCKKTNAKILTYVLGFNLIFSSCFIAVSNMTETVVLQIPEALYQRLAIASEAKLRSLEEIILFAIAL